MAGNDLPPLDECLSAMDERIEFLSSALSSLSEELTSRKPAAGGAANPLAVELARVKAKLKETEAKLTNNGGAAEVAALRDQVRLLELENSELRAAGRTGEPSTSPLSDGRGSASELKVLKSKLVSANSEIERLKKALAAKTEELEGMEDALETAKQQAACVFAPLPLPSLPSLLFHPVPPCLFPPQTPGDAPGCFAGAALGAVAAPAVCLDCSSRAWKRCPRGPRW